MDATHSKPRAPGVCVVCLCVCLHVCFCCAPLATLVALAKSVAYFWRVLNIAADCAVRTFI